jgi:hypothetical protein
MPEIFYSITKKGMSAYRQRPSDFYKGLIMDFARSHPVFSFSTFLDYANRDVSDRALEVPPRFYETFFWLVSRGYIEELSASESHVFQDLEDRI